MLKIGNYVMRNMDFEYNMLKFTLVDCNSWEHRASFPYII